MYICIKKLFIYMCVYLCVHACRCVRVIVKYKRESMNHKSLIVNGLMYYL